jgi:hypothetical protein
MGHANAVREAERDGRATGNHQTGFSEMWQLRALFRAGVPETPKEEPRGIDWEADQAALEKRTQTPGSDAPKWWSGSVSTPWEEVILTGCRGRDPNL